MRTDIQKSDTNTKEVQEAKSERRPKILPAYDVWETEGKIMLRVEMPGLERENVDITVDNNQLIISGQRPDWNVNGTFLVRERRFGDFHRVFNLDETVDTDSIEAEMSQGVLTLHLKIKEAAQPRKVQIKAG